MILDFTRYAMMILHQIMHFFLAMSSVSGLNLPGCGRRWISKMDGQYLPVTKILFSSLSQAMPACIRPLHFSTRQLQGRIQDTSFICCCKGSNHICSPFRTSSGLAWGTLAFLSLSNKPCSNIQPLQKYNYCQQRVDCFWLYLGPEKAQPVSNVSYRTPACEASTLLDKNIDKALPDTFSISRAPSRQASSSSLDVPAPFLTEWCHISPDRACLVIYAGYAFRLPNIGPHFPLHKLQLIKESDWLPIVHHLYKSCSRLQARFLAFAFLWRPINLLKAP